MTLLFASFEYLSLCCHKTYQEYSDVKQNIIFVRKLVTSHGKIALLW